MTVQLPLQLSRAEINRRALATEHLVADLSRGTARGGAIAVSAQVIRMALQLVTMMILARVLAPADFGLVAMAAAVTGFVGMFTDFGLSMATVQREKLDQDTVSALFLMNLAMGMLMTVAVIALAPAAAWFFGDPRVRWVVTALALPIPLLAASRQHASLLQRGMRWLAIELTAIAAQLVAAMVAILIAWRTDLGYWALVVQAWVGAALTLTLLWSVCPWRPSKVRDWSRARPALRFGLHLTGFQLLNYCNRQSDNVLIGWRWGAAEPGQYTRAYALLMLPLQLINGPVGSAVVPALSRIQSDPERWRRAYLEALGMIVLPSAGITAVLIATAKPLVGLLYGPGWSETASIFAILAISMLASTPMNATGWIYISLARTKRMFQWSLIRTPLTVAAFLVGLPFGGLGVAVAYTCVVIATFLPGLAFATRGSPIGVRQMLRIVVPPSLAGMLAAGCGTLAGVAADSASDLRNLAVAGSTASLVYLGIAGIVIWLDPELQRVQQRLAGYLAGAAGRAGRVYAAAALRK
jgi:O-antigen/teichoic acid export membrane protein